MLFVKKVLLFICKRISTFQTFWAVCWQNEKRRKIEWKKCLQIKSNFEHIRQILRVPILRCASITNPFILIFFFVFEIILGQDLSTRVTPHPVDPEPPVLRVLSVIRSADVKKDSSRSPTPSLVADQVFSRVTKIHAGFLHHYCTSKSH